MPKKQKTVPIKITLKKDYLIDLLRDLTDKQDLLSCDNIYYNNDAPNSITLEFEGRHGANEYEFGTRDVLGQKYKLYFETTEEGYL